MRVILTLVFFVASAFSQNLRLEMMKKIAAAGGPQGAAAGGFEYQIDGTEVLYRRIVGPANQPFEHLPLPRAARKIAATGSDVFVWMEGSELWKFHVAADGPQCIGELIPLDSAEAAEALERRDALPASAQVHGQSSVVINPQRLLVANVGTVDPYTFVMKTGGGDSLTVVNVQTNASLGTFPLATGDGPSAVAVMPDNSVAYVANFGSCDTCFQRGISIFDINKQQFIGKIQGSTPYTLALTPDGAKLFAADVLNTTAALDVIDTKTNKQVTQVQLALVP